MKLNAKGCKCSKEFRISDLRCTGACKAMAVGFNERNAEELLYLIRISKRPNDMAKSVFDELKEIVDEKGFIRHDFDEKTFGLMRLARKVFKLDEKCPESKRDEWEKDNKKFLRCTCSFESNEEYENFENFSDEKVERIQNFLREKLPKDEYEVLELLYGFGDAMPRNRAEVARLLGYSYRTVTHLLVRAEAALVQPSCADEFRNLMLS